MRGLGPRTSPQAAECERVTGTCAGGVLVTIRGQEALRLVREAAAEAPGAGEFPACLAAVEQVRVEAVLEATRHAQAPAIPPADRVLTIEEAAARLGRSRWWIYRHKAALPVVRFQTGGYGISEEGLRT